MRWVLPLSCLFPALSVHPQAGHLPSLSQRGRRFCDSVAVGFGDILVDWCSWVKVVGRLRFHKLAFLLLDNPPRPWLRQDSPAVGMEEVGSPAENEGDSVSEIGRENTQLRERKLQGHSGRKDLEPTASIFAKWPAHWSQRVRCFKTQCKVLPRCP